VGGDTATCDSRHRSHYQLTHTPLPNEKPTYFDPRAARAAHSLYRNRLRLEQIHRRIDRATAHLMSTLALSGQTHAIFGLYEVALDDEQALHLERLPDPDHQQLRLPDEPVYDLVDTLPPGQHEILERAASGDVACPWCDEALHGEASLTIGEPTVRLSCCQCGFEEV